MLRERVEQEIRERESRSVRPALPPQTALPPAYERQQQIFFPPKPMTPIPRPPERFQTPQRMPIYEQVGDDIFSLGMKMYIGIIKSGIGIRIPHEDFMYLSYPFKN